MPDARRPVTTIAHATTLAALALGLLASCSPSNESAPAPAATTPGASAPATPATAAAAPGTGAYDPAKDPLVNPPAAAEKAPADAKEIASDETLVRYLDGNPNNLNPLFTSSLIENHINDLINEGPFTYNLKMEWMIDPVYSETLEESADHRVWTVKLKPGLKWQDGQAFTSDDVCFSWREIMDERVPCTAVRSGTDQITKCDVLDARTFKLTHKEALPTNSVNASFPIIPKHIYEKDLAKNPDLKTGEYYVNANRLPVLNGPYKIVSWKENDRIELERWEDYPGPKPHFRRLVFLIIPDANAELLTFNKGEIDEFRLTSKQFATQTGQDSDFAKVGVKLKAPQWDYVYIGWNMDGSNPFFGDARVRRAMTHATDIQRMIRDLSYNLVTPCHGIFHPDAQWAPTDVKLLEFDLDKAAKLLDEAGWTVNEKEGGYRYKTVDGKPVKLAFTMNLPVGKPESRDAATILQEDLKGIGVALELQVIEWATFIERCRKHEFQSYLAGWGTGVDPDTQWNMWRSDQYDKDGNIGRNYVGYKNPRVDELFEAGRHEFDPEKRRQDYQEIARLIYQDQPYTFLWNRSTLWALNKRIRGVELGPRGPFNTYPSVLAWWVPATMQKYPAAKP